MTAFFPFIIDPATHRVNVTFLTMASAIVTCTLFHGSVPAPAGNAAKRLARNRHIAAISSSAAGIFLIGFGIKLITN